MFVKLLQEAQVFIAGGYIFQGSIFSRKIISIPLENHFPPEVMYVCVNHNGVLFAELVK